MESAGGHRDAAAANAKQARDRVLGGAQLLRPISVIGHEQPSRDALVDGMKPTAQAGLCNLHEQCVDVTTQKLLQLRAVPVPERVQSSHIQSHRIAGDANPGRAERVRPAEQDRKAHRTLVAFHRHLNSPTLVDSKEQRDDRIVGKVDMAYAITRRAKHLILSQRDGLEARVQSPVLLSREFREDPIRNGLLS